MEKIESSGTEKRGPGRPPKEKPLDKILAPEPEVAKESIIVPGNLTPEEQAIFARVAQDNDDWRTISEEESVDYSLQNDPFEPPIPAKKLEQEKKFKFRWVTRSTARLDEVKNKPVPFRWWPVNLNQPVGLVFKPFIDPNNGCVSREDQMLMFKPWWMFEKERTYKQGLADSSFRSKTLESKNGETRRSGRDSDVEIAAGKRVGNIPLRQEIKGSDIQYGGESEADYAAGRSTPLVSDSDLTVEE